MEICSSFPLIWYTNLIQIRQPTHFIYYYNLEFIKWNKIICLTQMLIPKWSNEIMMSIPSREHQHRDRVEAIIQIRESHWDKYLEDLGQHIAGVWIRWQWLDKWWWTWVPLSTDLTQMPTMTLSIFQLWPSRDLTPMPLPILALIILKEKKKLKTFSLVHHRKIKDSLIIIDNLGVHTENLETMGWQIVHLG